VGGVGTAVSNMFYFSEWFFHIIIMGGGGLGGRGSIVRVNNGCHSDHRCSSLLVVWIILVEPP
jgi:hypothetical protein